MSKFLTFALVAAVFIIIGAKFSGKVNALLPF